MVWAEPQKHQHRLPPPHTHHEHSAWFFTEHAALSLLKLRLKLRLNLSLFLWLLPPSEGCKYFHLHMLFTIHLPSGTWCCLCNSPLRGEEVSVCRKRECRSLLIFWRLISVTKDSWESLRCLFNLCPKRDYIGEGTRSRGSGKCSSGL